jgi:long-chain acyl-CoA synthetase
MNMGSLLPRHARFRGDRTALVVGDRRLSYRQLNAYVNRLASALRAAGLGKGDKLTTVLGNGLELMAAYWAAAKTGIIIVPASPLLQEAGLAMLVRDSDTIMVLAHASFAEILDRIRSELPAIRRRPVRPRGRRRRSARLPRVRRLPGHGLRGRAAGGGPRR